MGLTSYCLLLATEELLSCMSVFLRAWVISPQYCAMLLCHDSVSPSSTSGQYGSGTRLFFNKYFCAGLLVASWVLYYGSHLKLHEVLSTQVSARADVLENSYKLDEKVKTFYYVNIWSYIKESFLKFCGSLFLM